MPHIQRIVLRHLFELRMDAESKMKYNNNLAKKPVAANALDPDPTFLQKKNMLALILRLELHAGV